jgi:6-phosphofructokinase 1
MRKNKIAILTSGGDAPGMNAAVRAVAKMALANGLGVVGIRRGYNGLINGDVFEMNSTAVSDIIELGGTVLFSARCPEFKTEEGFAKAKAVCKNIGIDGIVVIGGDGSFMGASKLSNAGVPCIGIPGTIDNDIASSDYTIGFDTAMNTALEMIEKLRDTTRSHDRCSVVEVMGRHCGDIALYTGVACGATAILVPEVPYDFEKDVIQKIKSSISAGKTHFIIVVAEGVGRSAEIAKKIEESTGVVSRATVLGHIQRGGTPTLKDRVVATQMGIHAVNIFLQGKSNRVVVMKNGEIIDYDIKEALEFPKVFNIDLYKTVLKISD